MVSAALVNLHLRAHDVRVRRVKAPPYVVFPNILGGTPEMFSPIVALYTFLCDIPFIFVHRSLSHCSTYNLHIGSPVSSSPCRIRSSFSTFFIWLDRHPWLPSRTKNIAYIIVYAYSLSSITA